MLIAGAFVASRAAWPRSPTPHASTLVVHSVSVPSDPALGLGLSNAISARLGGQQHLSIQSMGRGGGSSASQGSEANDRDTATASTLVLDGELAGSGPDISVLIRLTDVHNRTPVWSDRFVVRTNELFSAEDVIAERVVAVGSGNSGQLFPEILIRSAG
jgi:TolB-like protein